MICSSINYCTFCLVFMLDNVYFFVCCLFFSSYFHLYEAHQSTWPSLGPLPQARCGYFWSVCVCAVRLLSITYNNMQRDAGTVSSVTVQTHTTANRSLICPSSVMLFPATCNNSDFLQSCWLCVAAVCLVPSQRKVWWKPGQISKTTFNQDLAGEDEVVSCKSR